MRRPAALLAATAVAALAGCGGPDQSSAVRDTLNRFVQATAHRDYKTLCQQILAPRLVSNVEQIGLPCEIALSRGFGSVSKPRLSVRSVTVHGDRASAAVHTSAANQAPLDGTISLVRIGGHWRVASLATAGG